MGSSSWSDDFYKDRVDHRTAVGATAFVYNSVMESKPRAARVTHALLDPKEVVRESRDSEAHPNSLAIGILLDVTGSMHEVPKMVQAKLPQLMGILTAKGYVADPQVLFAAVGDSYCDRSPLQVGQFESGLEMEDDLGRMYLEGGGGGGYTESYQDGLYFFARHTSTDCVEKRNKKGYLFVIGDEYPYPHISPAQAKSIFGDVLQEALSTESIIKECSEKYNIFYILPKGTSNWASSTVKEHWERLLGPQNVILLNDVSTICETIATAIGLCEGNIDLDDASENMRSTGATAKVVEDVTAALGVLANSAALAKVGTGKLPEAAGKVKTARL